MNNSDTPNTPKKEIDIISFLEWILGGISLLNLIDDLTPVNLLGKLGKWMNAYTIGVERIGNFLFGWINFQWININTPEVYVLIIGLVIISAYFRAEVKREKNNGRSIFDANGIAFFTSFIYFLIIITPALLLPSWFGLLGSIIAITIICVIYFVLDDVGREYASRKVIFRELIGVVIVFMLLILLNYTFFSSGY